MFDHSVVGLEAAPGRRAGKLPKICSGEFDIAFRGVFNNVQFVPFDTCVVFGCVKKSVTLQGRAAGARCLWGVGPSGTVIITAPCRRYGTDWVR